MEFIIILFIFWVISLIVDMSAPKSKHTQHEIDVARRRLTEEFDKHQSKPSSSSYLDSTTFVVDPLLIGPMKKAYLKSNEWQRLRLARLKLDHYSCAACGTSGVPLEIHHLHYRTFTAEDLDDLRSVCRCCHERQHQHYGFSYTTNFYPLV